MIPIIMKYRVKTGQAEYLRASGQMTVIRKSKSKWKVI